jgi:drug/metabolite transporter (DMT)-like permease
MRRRWPKSIWFGLALVVASPILYVTVFILNPATRDIPWPTLLMFAAGLGLLVHGVLRAWRAPQACRGKVVAPIALAAGLAVTGFFCFGFFYAARQLPDSLGAPRVGQLAPDFTLPDQDGRPISLAQLLAPPAAAQGGPAGPSNGAMLVFYRGHW